MYESRGFNRHTFAQRAALDYAQIIKWEKGEKKPELGSIRKAATALECAPVDLMDDEDLGTTIERDEDPRAKSPYPEVDTFIDDMLKRGQMTKAQARELATDLRFSNAEHATRDAAAEELRAIVRRESGLQTPPKAGTIADTKTGAKARNVRAVGGKRRHPTG